VPVDMGIVVTLMTGLRKTSLCVSARNIVCEDDPLLDRSGEDGKQPGALLVDEGHGVQLVFVQYFEQWRHVDSFVKREMIVDANGQRQGGHQLAAAAGEKRQRFAPRPLLLEPDSNRRRFAPQLGSQRILQMLACFLHEIIEGCYVRSPDVAGRIEVQEYAQDAGTARIELLELFDVSHGEHGG